MVKLNLQVLYSGLAMVHTIVRPLIKYFHILSSSNVNEMGSHWVLFLLYLNIVLNWPEDGPLRPKHVAKYSLIVITSSCLDRRVCCVLTLRNILYKFDNTQRDGLSQQIYPLLNTRTILAEPRPAMSLTLTLWNMRTLNNLRANTAQNTMRLNLELDSSVNLLRYFTWNLSKN